MPITSIQIAVPLAIAASIAIAKLSRNPFLMLASWFSLAAHMAFVISDLVQAILKLVQVGENKASV
jgi:hypothetical protein